MRTSLRRPARRTALLAFALALTSLGTPAALGQSVDGLAVPNEVVGAIDDAKQARNYIVWMADDPVVAYDGSIKGYPATKPNAGQKINPNHPNVLKYQGYLNAGHERALSAAGVGLEKKFYDYTVSFNGFAAEMTGLQAAVLASSPDVLGVFEDELMQPSTTSTPDFLGLTGEDGSWDLGAVGENVIIGIVDSGIWPENPAFDDRTDKNPQGKSDKLGYQQIPGWHGRCVPGDAFDASMCNQKLIGAQFYGAGWGGKAGIAADFPYEFWSARDADGHGSHTASTAGGNEGVEVVVDGSSYGEMSGIAPRARIASYKVCWGIAPEGGCFGSDSVAAIDQAVADGVDVINFSISGTSTNFLDAVEVAFLFAADAGVFVAASAGNAGPAASTVAHPSPWITTVAAGTHDRYSEATVTLGNAESYTGAALAGGVAGDLVYSANVGMAGADPTEVQLCYPGTLDPSLVEGKIVLCDRGVIARTDKSAAVAQAGGIGMIHANTEPSSINADLHSVPTIHVDHIDGAAIRAYAQTAGATASFSAATPLSIEAPFTASFSSRGPLLASGDLLKPDIMAPGQDIIAAVSPIGYNGRNFDSLSGTSMSSPHVAGLAAGIMSVHPGWSPAMVKSALMTTAGQTTSLGNPISGTPFDWGSGHVVPVSALDPGLVYDAGFLDYLGFLCGTGQLTASYCPSIGIDPSDLNQPNIAIGELAGEQTVTRTVTNVGEAGVYSVSVDAPVGVDVVVSPETLDLAPGESADYQVTFTTTGSATIGSYTFGALSWSDGTHNVTSQLVVRPVQLAAPAEVSGEGVEGSLSYDVTFGYSGDFTAAPHGLVEATTQSGNVVDDPANDINTALGTGVGITVHVVPIPAGTAHTRISLFDDFTDGADDLDLYVFRPNGSFLAGSGSATSAEQVDIAFPAAGNYFVIVHGWQTDGPDANYTLFDWSVPAAPGGGSLVVDAYPSPAVLGTTGAIDLSWSGLTAGSKYMGAVSYTDTGLFGITLVRVDG